VVFDKKLAAFGNEILESSSGYRRRHLDDSARFERLGKLNDMG
jgi:hypothetical protein